MYRQQYTRELSRQYPGLFVILLDRSLSMSGKIVGSQHGETKAHVVTRHVNTIIQELIDNAGVEETHPGIRKKYAYVSVLGYDDQVRPLLSSAMSPVDIPTLARHPLGTVPEVREVKDVHGRVIRSITQERRYWIKPGWGQNTNMALAFEHAMDVVAGWLKQPPELMAPDMGHQNPRQESFPPVVINVTDGYYNTGGNPRRIVEALSRLQTNNGNVLVFNCHFTTENKTPVIFPKYVQEIEKIDEYGYAAEMFYMSSELPDSLHQRACRTLRVPIEKGSRCVIYNASLDVLIRFLRWGTVGINPATGTGGR